MGIRRAPPGTVAQSERGVATRDPFARRGPERADTRRRDAGINPAGPGTIHERTAIPPLSDKPSVQMIPSRKVTLRRLLLLGCTIVPAACTSRLTPEQRQARATNAALYEYAAVRQGVDGTCWFRRQGDYSQVMRFQCGSILLSIRPISDASLRRLVRSLHAQLDSNRPAPNLVVIRVASGQELAVIRRALRDDRVLGANLNWNGVVIR